MIGFEGVLQLLFRLPPSLRRFFRLSLNGSVRRLRPAVADSPEMVRVKLISYLCALLVATPGLVLLLLELVQRAAYPYAVAHGAVMLGAAVLFVYVLRSRTRIQRAERYFAVLLCISAIGFLVLYGTQPDQVLSYQMLGSVLLFIAAGLLLVLPPLFSIPLSLVLLGTCFLEIAVLSGAPVGERRLTQWVNLGLLALLMVGVVMRQTLTELTSRVQLLEELATHDPLTRLMNRRGFEEKTAALRLKGRSGALVVLDIDDFKLINDAHGHVAGDRVLSDLARLLERLTGQTGVCARWGGEEFLLFLPDHDLRAALAVAESLRLHVQGRNRSFPVTVSLGVSLWPAHEGLHYAFMHADTAMYQAKRQGKNRVVCANQTLHG